MKTNLTKILVGAACGLALSLTTASASLVTFSSGTLNTTVPDGNSGGIASTINVSSPGIIISGSGDNVTLTLNMSGGNNGDLYAYLSYGGQTVTLLNRPGLAGDPAGIGYTTSGFSNVHLSDGGYGNINTTQYPTTGGTYNPSEGSTAFRSYNGMNPNGGWVLFVSDLSGGDSSNLSVLNSWSLTFDVVPEPVNVALGVFAALLLFVAGLRWAWRALMSSSLAS
ncbi:MAG TPA: hypothetical protein VIJ24_05020 [Verrucomicrobiae bacterium]